MELPKANEWERHEYLSTMCPILSTTQYKKDGKREPIKNVYNKDYVLKEWAEEKYFLKLTEIIQIKEKLIRLFNRASTMDCWGHRVKLANMHISLPTIRALAFEFNFLAALWGHCLCVASTNWDFFFFFFASVHGETVLNNSTLSYS